MWDIHIHKKRSTFSVLHNITAIILWAIIKEKKIWKNIV